MKRKLKPLIILICTAIISIILINAIMVVESAPYIYSNIDDLPESQTVIVLGAFVRGDSLSMVLEDRVDAGVEIYECKKVDKILLTGDHSSKDYDEVNGMRKYILKDANFKKRRYIFRPCRI